MVHNYEWLSRYREGIREFDLFYVNIGTYYHEWLVKHDLEMLDSLNLDKNRFIILANDIREYKLFAEHGFQCIIANNCSWLDSSQFSIKSSAKEFDAVYVARDVEFKRHFLAERIENLALVCGPPLGEPKGSADALKPKWRNSHVLTNLEVSDIISKSKVGLILSENEGACYASSEYLLSGIPVVSTASLGGRDYFYNSYNSIVCNPDPMEIRDAVEFFCKYERDPEEIRRAWLCLQERDIQSLINRIQHDFDAHGIVDQNAINFFKDNFIHKMRYYMVPDFEALFAK